MPIATRVARPAIAMAGAVLLSACAFGVSVPVKTVVQKAPISIPLGTKLVPIKLDRVSFNIKRGTPIGEYIPFRGIGLFGQNFCRAAVPNVYWNQGRVLVRDIELEDLFYEAFSSANYNVIGDPKRIFSDAVRDNVKARYLIGAQVTEIAMQICELRHWYDGLPLDIQSGTGSIKVKWQVFSRLEERVVVESVSEGFAKIDDGVPGGEIAIISEAFANAAANFAADRDIYNLVSKPEPTLADIRAVDEAVLLIDRRKLSRRPITDDIDLIRRSVVTIDAGAGGFGSGFFISPRLIMTNHHVVEGSTVMRVTLVTGRKILGEVVRRHPERDVALIQVEDAGHRPLAIRMEPLKITEEVYAIGSPLDRSASGTVTRGIVSKFRSNRFGLEDIQADVDIQPGNSGGALLDSSGNAVGITYAGKGELSIGVNFFIPIYDAIEKLNIEFKDEARRSPPS